MSKLCVVVFAAMLAAGVALGQPMGWFAMQQTVQVGGGDTVAFPTNGLLAGYSMESVSGSTINDVFGVNNATMAFDQYFFFDDAYGIVSNGVRCVIGGGINISTPIDINANADFSISLWVKSDATSTSTMNIIHDRKNSSSWQIVTTGLPENTRFNIYRWSGASFGLIQTDTLDATELNHVCMVYDKSSSIVTGYINGTSFGTISGDIDDYTQTIEIMNDVGSSLVFRGEMDEVYFYESALSQQEVDALYNSGLGKTYTP